MKYLITLMLACLSLTVQAQVFNSWFASAKNNAGGEIVLYLYQADCPEGTHYGRAFSAEGTISEACWIYEKPYIHMFYRNKTQKTYDSSGWTINPELQKRMKSQPKETQM